MALSLSGQNCIFVKFPLLLNLLMKLAYKKKTAKYTTLSLKAILIQVYGCRAATESRAQFWVEFVVGFCLVPRVFFPALSDFSPSLKNQHFQILTRPEHRTHI